MPNRRRKWPAGEQRPGREELAFVVPFFGTLLLLPPLVDLFVGKDLVLFGLPLESLYLFAVWLFMIVGAVVLARCQPFRDPLASNDEHSPDEPDRLRTGPASGAGHDSGRFGGVD